MAGVPFEPVEALATPGAIEAARRLAARQREYNRAAEVARVFFSSREHLLSQEAFRSLHTAVRLKRAPMQVVGEQPRLFTDYAAAASELAAAEIALTNSLERDVQQSRARLLKLARELLPRQLIFTVGGVRELLSTLLSPETPNELPPRRNTRAAERERHLLLYLQRICTKNDSFSEFGPTGWGRATTEIAGATFDPKKGIAARETFLERWTAHTAAAAVNSDAESFAELSPRLSPHGLTQNGFFVSATTGAVVELTPQEADIAGRCDGATPVHALHVDVELIRGLVAKGVLVCALEVPAVDPHAFETLRQDLTNWRPGAARDKWLAIIDPIAELPRTFARQVDRERRQQLLDTAREQLESLGGARKAGGRFLYAAANPIGEECVRETGFQINEATIQEVATEAAPWIDLWRDSYAFVASRVAEGLRGILERLPTQNGALPLPAFLHACESARLPLTGPGLVALAHIAFQEVKAAFGATIKSHANDAEYELTTQDCHVVRRTFEYPKFDEYTYPSADLQLAAKTMGAVSERDYQWILAELHPPAALLHHGAYWSCPDFPALTRALQSTTFGRPNFHFGFFAVDFTAHTTVRLLDALPELTNFVAPQRVKPNHKAIAPADTEVFVDSSTGDVVLRRRGTQEYLGSFARAWLIPLGFHPFYFSQAPHTPRLRCGNVIVQRRSWTITLDELGPGDYTAISRDLVLAIEQLRAAKELPRYVYVRPTEQALRRSGAEGRDKDTKPVFIDFESYLFMEIFHRWLVKAGELDVTEMLPDPDHLCWMEADGRRTFELRTLIVPR
jgi:hypothetical protein